MILDILLLIAEIYLSIVITLLILLLITQLIDNKKEIDEVKKANERRETKLDKILHLSYKLDTKSYNEMTASEALFGFTGWLTSRKKLTRMSSRDDAGEPAILVQQFIHTNKLDNPRDNWENNLKHPK